MLTVLAVTVVLGACTDALASGPLPPGVWGGEGIRLEVTADGGTVEFDCASGTVDAPLRAVAGRVEAPGTFTFGHGGPIREDEVPDTRGATYAGWVDGRTLSLEVRIDGLADEDRPRFRLRHGDPGRLRLCL